MVGFRVQSFDIHMAELLHCEAFCDIEDEQLLVFLEVRRG